MDYLGAIGLLNVHAMTSILYFYCLADIISSDIEAENLYLPESEFYHTTSIHDRQMR